MTDITPTGARKQADAATLRDDLALVRQFIEHNGYEVINTSSGRSAVPMDTVQVAQALDRIEALAGQGLIFHAKEGFRVEHE